MQFNNFKFVSIVIGLCILFTISGFSQTNDNKGEAQFLSNTRQLIYDGKRSGEGYFSPDGKLMTFQSEREPGNPFFQIYILDFESGESHRVSPGTGKTTCSFIRPGADEVLFASSHLDPDAVKDQEEEIALRKSGQERRYSWDYDVHMDIFSTKLDGSNIKRLTNAYGYDAEGSYSPDGSKIVFGSLRNGYPMDKLSSEERKRMEVDPSYFGEIYIMNADGSNQTRLTDWPGYDGGPFFSPDGKLIIWRHFDESGLHADVYTMKPDGSDRHRLTDFGAMSWAPYFHPSQKYVAFASNKLGFSNFEVFMVDAAGEKEPVRVTFTDGFDGLPVFTPDGKKMVWTSNRTPGGESQLFIADWNHEAALAAMAAAPPRNSNNDSLMGSNMKAQPAAVQTASAGKITAAARHEFTPEVSASDLRANVEYLASDELEGRLTGSPGTQKAAAYIANQFKKLGLKPLGDSGTYFQEFPFTSGVKVVSGKNSLTITTQGRDKPATTSLKLDEDFRPLAFTSDEEVEGEVVFAGYGLSIPGDAGKGYDSYANLDVKDKIVLVLRYVPEEVSVERRQELNRSASLQFKALAARKQGARGLLVVTGPTSPNAGELVPLSFDQGMGSAGIQAASISGKTAEKLFAAAGKDLKTIQAELDKENPHAESGFTFPNIKVKLVTAVERQKRYDRNVIALLPSANESNDSEYIMAGAHYDHIGHGEIGSLARQGEEGQIHNGADDNASGTSTVLELAAAFTEARNKNPEKFSRGIIFALWSGEEMGIIGSSYFAENPTVPLEKIAAYFNFDMVGRLKDNTLMLQGIGSSNIWRKLIEKRNVMAGFSLVLQDDPYLPTDVTAFYPRGIPVIAFFTGSHEDYNRPTDDPETLNYKGMERIGSFADKLMLDVVKEPERPDYVKVERKEGQGEGRASLRAYLGTVPDFVPSDIEGVKLSSVRADGPADKAGLKGGDIIVEFAGQKITNIYDYTYALEAAKIGEPTDVTVLRDGKEVKLSVVPEVRK